MGASRRLLLRGAYLREAFRMHAPGAACLRRLAATESEMKLCVEAAHQAEAAHGQEMAKVESDLKRVLGERRALVQRFQLIEVVEDALRDLYVQMKVLGARHRDMCKEGGDRRL